MRRFVNRTWASRCRSRRRSPANVIQSLRRYFLGVTIVAAFNAVVVGLGALLLDVPLAGTIAVVDVRHSRTSRSSAPSSQARSRSSSRSSSQGTTAALIMLVIVILANGLLQNIVQPIAFGATLDLTRSSSSS